MSILAKYNEIYSRISSLEKELEQARAAVKDIEDGTDKTIPERIEHLEKQNETIDEYLLKIKGFRQLAEQHIQSLNLQTIEAPPNYRVNLNRLRNWAMMIDPVSVDDPYAKKVYLVAKCDEFFLENKKKDFSDRIVQLRELYEQKSHQELERLRLRIREIEETLVTIATDPEMVLFAENVVTENRKHIFDCSKEAYSLPSEEVKYFAPGAYGLQLKIPEAHKENVKKTSGLFFDQNASRVYLPVERISPEEEFILTVNCIPSKKKVRMMDAGIRNFIMNILDKSPAGSRKVHVLDGERMNARLLGPLRALENTYVMGSCPRTEDQMSTAVENLVSGFNDLDEILENYDTVAEYNKENPSGKIPRGIVVIVGWPNQFKGDTRALLERLIVNYERYGLSLILVNISANNRKVSGKTFGLSDYISEGVIHVEMTAGDTSITIAGNTYKFAWYPLKNELKDSYVASLLSYHIAQESLGNKYINHYDMSTLPGYTRQYKKLELPFGINSKEQIQSISFENENFAAYLMGASRSGKSTLLHTLIAGMIRNYHPDNLELWLADFKQLEFEKYITYLPPHVKYVLLDESQELVFDLIDKLTEKMMQRQHLFARLGKERIDQIDPLSLKEPLPLIFVILDEFSIMSQSIAESPDYRLKLQNILAKGAALGIRFLFSSQTFTTGVTGLTPTARAQIQQRIAMKASKTEINETLELSGNMRTDQVNNWIDALPPHYALVKFRQGADSVPVVQRSLVLYFENYAPRNEFIQKLNQAMKPVEKYTPSDITTYVYKKPVTVDGKAYYPFDEKKINRLISDTKRSQDYSQEYSDEEILLSLGTPRLMTDTRFIPITQESRENILLISRLSELDCSASILLSAIKCFFMQNKKVQIWTYGKNKLYRAYKQQFRALEKDGLRIFEDNDQVCDAIYALKKNIEDKITEDVLIILLGMDRICGDFEYSGAETRGASVIDNNQYAAEREKQLAKQGALVQGKEDMDRVKLGRLLMKHKKELKQQLLKEGKTPDEIEKALQEETQKFLEEYQKNSQQNTAAPDKPEKPETPKPETLKPATAQAAPVHQPGAYNADFDFQYVLKQGSRSGYHFFMVLNNLSDLSQTHGKMDYFRHRLGFQMSKEDSREVFAFRNADELPEHVCQYYDTLDRFSFRPYINEGTSWDGWFIDEKGVLHSPFVFEE